MALKTCFRCGFSGDARQYREADDCPRCQSPEFGRAVRPGGVALPPQPSFPRSSAPPPPERGVALRIAAGLFLVLGGAALAFAPLTGSLLLLAGLLVLILDQLEHLRRLVEWFAERER